MLVVTQIKISAMSVSVYSCMKLTEQNMIVIVRSQACKTFFLQIFRPLYMESAG